MLRRVIILGILLFLHLTMVCQDTTIKSIHQFESIKYSKIKSSLQFADPSNSIFILNGIKVPVNDTLNKRVFGYHPYWSSNKYLNYQWHLLSDFCYFSYEVNPYSGEAVTVHDWDTSPSIDSAKANNVKVHLCVTLFSGHGSFFSNQESQQTLIDNVIELVVLRNADGVNMDVEAMSSSYREDFTEFMISLSEQMEEEIPDAELSFAAPAVNWSNRFDIAVLCDYVDFIMIMAYDYYWYGSSTAGPVSPLYSMTASYDYNFSRTISYYQSQGVPNEKIVMGVPYYAYQWPTEGQYAPSSTTNSGAAYTYSNIRNNTSGNYSGENQHKEPNSFGSYYSFYTNGWNQCFLDGVYGLAKKYDVVNRRDLGGIGIWALGYDNGYSELWNLIAEKFTTGNSILYGDTIFDSGGPAFDYYDDENYLLLLETPAGTKIHLAFSYLNLEAGYDTLWIYDGPDTLSPVISFYSGDSVPQKIIASSNKLLLSFFSDELTTDAGWRIVFDTIPVSGLSEYIQRNIDFKVQPNPANDFFRISGFDHLKNGKISVKIFNPQGILITETIIRNLDNPLTFNASGWPSGVYTILYILDDTFLGTTKLIVL